MATRGAAFDAWLGRGPRPPFWHLPAGLALAVAVWAGWTALAVRPMTLAGWPPEAGTSPEGLVVVLASLAGLWPAALAAGLLDGRTGPARLLSAPGRPAGAGFGAGFALGLGTALASGLLALSMAGLPERGPLALSHWALWLAPVAVLTLAQSSGEELLFRGWLARLLARRWRAPAIWAGLPALGFAALHHQPGALALLPVATAAAFALAAAALVWRCGGPAPAMGLHAGINLPALTLAGPEGPLAGALLWRWPEAGTDPVLVAGLATAILLLALTLSPLCPVRDRAPPHGPERAGP